MKANTQSAIGALLGSAVGDALGAPFEFGPAGQFTNRFPTPALGPSTEMIGGGGFGWSPGEFTDDTQMAIIIAESLLAHDGFDGADIFQRFQQWARSAPDVGAQTRSVLAAGDWQQSAAAHFERTGHAAGQRFVDAGDDVRSVRHKRIVGRLNRARPRSVRADAR